MERLAWLASKIPIFVLIAASAVAATGGEYTAKRWSMNPSVLPFILAIALYAVTGFLFMMCLPREKLIVVGILYDILTNASFLIMGFWIFHERLSPLQTVGAFFGLVSLVIFVIAEALE